MRLTYTPAPGEEIPLDATIGVALELLDPALRGRGRDLAPRLIAGLDRVGVAFGDMREWRRSFLRGHVAGENEDHRLAGVIADQADELDRLRAELDAAMGLICNAHQKRVDDVTNEDGASPGWAEAARRWIDAYPFVTADGT